MIRFASVERILCKALHIDARTWDQGSDRAMRPGMEPVVNSTVKMSGNG